MEKQTTETDPSCSRYSSMTLRQLKSEANSLKPIVQVGKNGLTEEIIEEVKKHLKKKKLIKVKFLRSAIDNANKRALAEDLSKRTGSTMVSLVGFVAALYKR